MNTQDLVKLAAEALSEDHWWEFADRLVDEVPAKGGGSPPPSGVKDGSYALLDDLSRAIEKEIGHRFTVENLRALRSTALAWPPGERDHEVEFAVHRRLRSPKAKTKLVMYKRRAQADYKRAPGYQGSPRLTEHRLKVYRGDERPTKPIEVVMAETARRIANKALSPEELDAWQAAFRTAFKARRAELHAP